jgi:hypothetical protein
MFACVCTAARQRHVFEEGAAFANSGLGGIGLNSEHFRLFVRDLGSKGRSTTPEAHF